MGKYLLLIIGILVVYWMWRSHYRRRNRDDPQKRIAEDMVRCADCGVYLPRGESLVAQGKFYCCADHQRRDGL